MRTGTRIVLMTAGDMSQATLTTPAQSINQAWGYAVQAVWTGSPVGDIKLQATIDGVTWSDITGTDQAVPGTGSFIWNVMDAVYDEFRVLYTKTSGTGSLAITIEYKGY